MPVIKIKIGQDARELSEYFDKMVDDFFQVGVSTSSLPRGWQPTVNVCEDETHVYIIADMAGVSREDCTVTVEDQYVRIRGRRESPLGPGNRKFHFMEIVYGECERIIKIPCECDVEATSAQLDNGLLVIRLAKVMKRHGIKIAVEEE